MAVSEDDGLYEPANDDTKQGDEDEDDDISADHVAEGDAHPAQMKYPFFVYLESVAEGGTDDPGCRSLPMSKEKFTRFTPLANDKHMECLT